MKKAVISFIVENEDNLYLYLKNKLVNKSKNNIKSMIINSCVCINGKFINKVDFTLKKGDEVIVYLKHIRCGNEFIPILYEDDYLISVYKPSGLLSISTTSSNNTIYSLVRNYLKKYNKNNMLFILHRLDRETSGVLLFSKSEKIKLNMQENWDKVVLKRGYLAIVNGIVNKDGCIKSYLSEKNNYLVVSSNNPNKGKLAITNYYVIKKGKKFSLLQIYLETGRKNQIRVHMNDIGHNILGDMKYGSVRSKRLYLHANILEFVHPVSKKIIHINCPCRDFDIKL